MREREREKVGTWDGKKKLMKEIFINKIIIINII